MFGRSEDGEFEVRSAKNETANAGRQNDLLIPHRLLHFIRLDIL